MDDLISKKSVVNIIKRHWLDAGRTLESISELPAAYEPKGAAVNVMGL